jgi:hypothetical protein
LEAYGIIISINCIYARATIHDAHLADALNEMEFFWSGGTSAESVRV